MPDDVPADPSREAVLRLREHAGRLAALVIGAQPMMSDERSQETLDALVDASADALLSLAAASERGLTAHPAGGVGTTTKAQVGSAKRAERRLRW